MHAPLVLDALNMAAWTRRGVEPRRAGLPQRRRLRNTPSIAYTDRLAEIGAAPSIGTIGDSFDNAMAETTIGLFKTELHRNPAALAANGGPWRGLDDLEIATCGWVVVVQRANASTANSTITPPPRSKPPTTATMTTPTSPNAA